MILHYFLTKVEMEDTEPNAKEEKEAEEEEKDPEEDEEESGFEGVTGYFYFSKPFLCTDSILFGFPLPNFHRFIFLFHSHAFLSMQNC